MTTKSVSPKLMRFREAYLAMAKEARYRPAAPGDGAGGIYLTDGELADAKRLEAEADEYALRFVREEDTNDFFIGCSDFRTNRAFVYCIEAARNLAGVENRVAVKLLKMAIAEIEKAAK